MSVAFINNALQAYYQGGIFSAINILRGNLSVEEQAELGALESRIASFEQIIIGALPPGENTYDYPFNAEGLKREFLDEVLVFLVKKGYSTHVHVSNLFYISYTPNPLLPDNRELDTPLFHNFTGVMTADEYNNIINNGGYPTNGVNSYAIHNAGTTTGAIPTWVSSFDALDTNGKLGLLSSSGQEIFNYYSSLIDQVFAEGEKQKLNPTEVGTDQNGSALGGSAQTNLVTAIPERTINGVTYDHVTTLRHPIPSGHTGSTLVVSYPDGTSVTYALKPKDLEAGYLEVTYLVEQGLETYTVLKEDLLNTAGTKVDFQLTFTDPSTKTTKYLPVNSATYAPLHSGPITLKSQRNMYATEYLYFWNEARNHVLRAQLAYNEAVTREMQNDLRQANAVLAELEGLAGQTRAQSNPDDDGNTTMNPDTTTETLAMDLFEAAVSKSGEQLFPGYGTSGSGADDLNNYTEWATNRTNLKNYIDRKSAHSQQAMLDYQTVLNRYNNAYEVFAKLQEKLQGLMGSMFRNIGG